MFQTVMITVTYNSEKFLHKLIKSAMQAFKTYRIDCWIFIDCNSGDRTVDLLYRFKQSIKDLNIIIIRENKNLGFSKAVEKAISYIHKSLKENTLLIICNPDGYFKENSLDNLINCFIRKKGLGAVQPVILRPDGSIDSLGNLMSKAGLICPRLSFKVPYFYISGACFVTNYKIYKEVGGLDTDIFMGADDLDFSWRIKLAGLKLGLCREAVFYHYRRSGKETSPKRFEWRLFSVLWSMIKNMPYKSLLIYLPLTVIVNMYVAFALSIYYKKAEYITHYLNAITLLFNKINILLKKRLYVRHIIRKVPDHIVLKDLTGTGYILKHGYQWYLKWRR